MVATLCVPLLAAACGSVGSNGGTGGPAGAVSDAGSDTPQGTGGMATGGSTGGSGTVGTGGNGAGGASSTGEPNNLGWIVAASQSTATTAFANGYNTNTTWNYWNASTQPDSSSRVMLLYR